MHHDDSIHLRGKQTKKNTFEDYKFYLPQSNLFFFSAGGVRKPVPFHLILMIHLLLDSVKLSNTRSSVLCFWRAEVLVQVLSLPFFLPSTAMVTPGMKWQVIAREQDKSKGCGLQLDSVF